MNAVLLEIYSTILPSAPFVIAAYGLFLGVLFLWLGIQFSSQRKLSRRLEILEEQQAELQGSDSDWRQTGERP